MFRWFKAVSGLCICGESSTNKSFRGPSLRPAKEVALCRAPRLPREQRDFQVQQKMWESESLTPWKILTVNLAEAHLRTASAGRSTKPCIAGLVADCAKSTTSNPPLRYVLFCIVRDAHCLSRLKAAFGLSFLLRVALTATVVQTRALAKHHVGSWRIGFC